MSEINIKPKETIYGICDMYFNGTNWWCAVQDIIFITQNVAQGYCKKCGKWLRKDEDEDEKFPSPRVLFPNSAGSLSARPDCRNDAHEEEIGDEFDDEGLRKLKNGDYLTIYSKLAPWEAIWAGVIQLDKDSLFQEGVDPKTWAMWFAGGYHAVLVTDSVQSEE